jgi:hypothetical protein
MSRVSGSVSRSIGGSNARHRSTSTSPQFGSYSVEPMAPPMENHLSPNTEKKGFSVKKTGMNNPLHKPQQVSQSQPIVSSTIIPNRSTTTTTAAVPVRNVVPPSNDDFFAEMGVASKSKFGPISPATTKMPNVKRLGATSLPLDDDENDDDDLLTGNGRNSTSKDTWGDDDLDDLLDS